MMENPGGTFAKATSPTGTTRSWATLDRGTPDADLGFSQPGGCRQHTLRSTIP